MKKKIIFTSLMLTSSASWATIDTMVDRNIVEQGQNINLTIIVPSISANPDLSPLQKDFQIVGKSTSSQTSIVNGSINSQTSIRISLVPNHLGKITIPAIKIDKDSTKSIQIEVTKNNTTKSANIPDKALFLKSSLDKTTSYIGVPVVLSIKLYVSLNVGNLNLSPFQIDGAHIDKLNEPNQYQSEANGRPYMVLEQKFLVTPDKAGKISIPEIQLNGSMASNNPMGLGVATGQSFNLQTSPLFLEVKDAPKNINPNEWLPAKNVTANEIWSEKSNQITVGEPITRTVTINADGVNASVIPELDFTKVNDTNIYPDKTISDTKNSNSGVSSNKVFKIVYIPTKSGELKFPETKINWFDINNNQEKTITLPAKTFRVVGEIKKNTFINNTKQVSSENYTAKTKKTNLWEYISYMIGGLWILTIAIFFIYRRKKQQSRDKINNKNESIKSDSLTHETTTVKKKAPIIVKSSIDESCQSKDIYCLNKALIDWANTNFDTKIKTIDKIKSLVHNQDIHNIIDDLNAALYDNKSFNKFEEINTLINSYKKTNLLAKKTKGELPKMYPFDVK